MPAVLPTAASRFPVEAESYLRAVPATFTGLLIGVLLSGFLIRTSSLRFTVAIGSLVQAAAMMVLVTTPPASGFVLAAGFAGLGFGLVEAAGSALARESAQASVTRLLAALTGTVALVAASCPLVVAFLPSAYAAAVALLLVAGLHVVTVACLLAGSRNGRPSGAVGTRDRRVLASPTPAQSRAAGAGRSSWPVRETAAVAVALALYVGVESVYSGWSAVMAVTMFAADPRRAAVGTSAFWVLMAVGRFVAWRLLRSRPARTRQLLFTLAGAAALLLVSASTDAAVAGVAVAGAVILLGPCYSMIMGLGLTRVASADAARVTTPLVACGAVGGAGVPWLVLTVAGSPTGPSVAVLGAALLAIAGALLLPRRPADELSGRGIRSRAGRPRRAESRRWRSDPTESG